MIDNKFRNATSGVTSTPGVNFDYTYDGILETDITVCEDHDVRPISDFFRVVETAKYKIQVPVVGTIQNVVKRSVSCPRAFSNGIDITNATVELTELEANLSWCKTDFEETLNVGNNLSETMLGNGNDEWEPGGALQQLIDGIVLDAVRRDTSRIFWWSDASDADTNWNQLVGDGVWPKLISQNTPGNAYCVRRASTTLGTGTLAAGVALTALQELYTESAIVLKQLKNSEKYFAVTGSVYENLLASYETNVNGTERMFTNLVAGQADGTTVPLSYRGISVIPMYEWDADLNDPGNPLFGTMAHGILYTTKNNHIAAINTVADSDSVTGFYNQIDREYWISAHYRMGYNMICCDLQSIAY